MVTESFTATVLKDWSQLIPMAERTIMATKRTPTAMTKTFFQGKISFFLSLFIRTEKVPRRDKPFRDGRRSVRPMSGLF